MSSSVETIAKIEDGFERIRKLVRESAPLPARLEESARRIALMCKERRGPRMTIPVHWSDDDEFICTTLGDAAAEIARLCRIIGHVPHKHITVSDGTRTWDDAKGCPRCAFAENRECL